MIPHSILDALNAPTAKERLENLRTAVSKAAFPPPVRHFVNNHVHTVYSFSPYSPTAAVYAARAEGLSTVGIVDHDSIAGAGEFIEAGKIAGIPTTVGMECRVKMTGTTLEDRRTNNPDQIGVSYMTLQGVPHASIERLNDFFAPRRAERNVRNRRMCERANALLSPAGVSVDFDSDVLPLSKYAEGGSVTERHISLALARKLLEAAALRETNAAALLDLCGVALTDGERAKLESAKAGDEAGEYAVLGVLKSAFIKRIFVPADAECPTLAEIVDLAADVGAILCYAYLGDVTASVTGDKAAQKFEDAFIEELFSELKRAGVGAVTYMPTRNTAAQLERVRALCDSFGMMQVSGEDINSPSQSFAIKAMERPEFSNLIDSTWKLIENENG